MRYKDDFLAAVQEEDHPLLRGTIAEITEHLHAASRMLGEREREYEKAMAAAERALNDGGEVDFDRLERLSVAERDARSAVHIFRCKLLLMAAAERGS